MKRFDTDSRRVWPVPAPCTARSVGGLPPVDLLTDAVTAGTAGFDPLVTMCDTARELPGGRAASIVA
jgi:hypothetical protein